MAKRKYDDKLRADVIEAVMEGGRSAAQVARDYDLPKTAVYTQAIKLSGGKIGFYQSLALAGFFYT